MSSENKRKRIESIITVAICTLGILFAIIIVVFNVVYPLVKVFVDHQTLDGGQQFVYLAQSFSHGHLYFTHQFDWSGEPSTYNGRDYYALGPFSAVILVPFVMLGEKLHFFFYQGFLSAPIFFLTAFFVYKIARRIGYGKEESFLLSCAFCFASPLIFVASLAITSFYSHVVTVGLLVLALYEYLGKKRLWLIGILFGCILLTRFTAALGISFFFFMILFEQKPWREKFKQWALLLMPFAFFVVVYALYNWLRFDNAFETGYSIQKMSFQFQTDARNTGLFALHHVKANAYHMFLGVPLEIGRSFTPIFWNNPDGVSIFLTSLYLLYFFRMKKLSKEAWCLIGSSALVAVPLLLSWSTGFYEVGSRFSLDYFPLLFIALILSVYKKYGKLPIGFVWLILGSMIFNYYLYMIWLAEHYLVSKS